MVSGETLIKEQKFSLPKKFVSHWEETIFFDLVVRRINAQA
jgi:hypothetical protein